MKWSKLLYLSALILLFAVSCTGGRDIDTRAGTDATDITDATEISQEPEPLEDGMLYAIRTDGYMGIGGSSFGTRNGEAAQIRAYSGDLDQLFVAVRTDGGWCFRNMSSGLMLSVRKTDREGTAACLSEEKSTFYSVWEIGGTERGFSLKNKETGRYLVPSDPDVTSDVIQTSEPSDDGIWSFRKEAEDPAGFPRILRLTGQYIGDSSCPSLIRYGDTYYNYNMTGRIRIKTSPDLIAWTHAGVAFDPVKPQWVRDKTVAGSDSIWAPDAWLYGNEVRLYYCVSVSGSQNAAIGLAKAVTPAGPFKDEGILLESKEGVDPYTCIDPRVFEEEDGTAYLVFGSHVGGIYMRKLDPSTGHFDESEPTLWHLGEGNRREMEAASIVKRDGYYYLFAAMHWLNDGYYLGVGRSEHLTGPYLDKDGRAMLAGYTTPLTEWKPGIEAAAHGDTFLDKDGTWYFVSEYWKDRKDTASVVSLHISTIVWTEDGWPVTALSPDLLRDLGQ